MFCQVYAYTSEKNSGKKPLPVKENKGISESKWYQISPWFVH